MSLLGCLIRPWETKLNLLFLNIFVAEEQLFGFPGDGSARPNLVGFRLLFP